MQGFPMKMIKKISPCLGLLIILALVVAAGPAYSYETTANKVKAEVLVKSTHSWNGNPMPDYPKGQPEVTILRIIVPAGTTLPWHTHPVINAGVLISGELTVTTKSGKVLEMKAGDPIVEVVDTWHYGKNTGTEPADIIVFYAGVKDQPITIKE